GRGDRGGAGRAPAPRRAGARERRARGAGAGGGAVGLPGPGSAARVGAGRPTGERVSLGDKQVLVTGAGGFIGSHLVEALVAEGARVRALCRYNAQATRGWLDQLPRATQD